MLKLDKSHWTLVEALQNQTRARGDELFCRFANGRQCSYGELDRVSDAFALGLARLGVGPGDRVMIIARNRLEFLTAFFGTQKRRAILVPINTEIRGDFLAHQVANCEPKVVIIDDSYSSDLNDIPWPEGTRFIQIGDDLPTPAPRPALQFSELCAAPDLPAVLTPAAEDICLILYTSGTSGPSKGVLIPQAHAFLFGLQQARTVSLQKSDTYYITLPMFHVNALLMALGACLLSGAEAFVAERFSASRWLSEIRQSGATVTNALGVMAEFILKQPPRPEDRDHKLTRVMAVPVSRQWAKAFSSRFGVDLIQVYGMTECNIVSYTRTGDSTEPGCVGTITDGFFDVRIVDPDTDNAVPNEAVGEIVIRPREPFCFMQGYYRMAERTVEAWRNLWFHTGDAGRIDRDGKLHFIDRIGDCIRRRGENISSFEIEQVLLTHPSVMEAAVVGIKVDGAGGEDEVCAYLVTTSADFDFPSFSDWCAARLPRYAVPRFLRLVGVIEKTATGKVRKRDLRGSGRTADMWDREEAGLRIERHRTVSQG